MLMFNKSPWLSMGTIIRYPQREIEKLIILSISYSSDSLEMGLRAEACLLSKPPYKHNHAATREALLAQQTQLHQ